MPEPTIEPPFDSLGRWVWEHVPHTDLGYTAYDYWLAAIHETFPVEEWPDAE